MSLSLVIFDLDGVLVHTDKLHRRAWAAIAQREGMPLTRATADRMRGVSRMESLEIMLSAARRVLSPEDRERLAEDKNRVYRTLLEALGPADLAPGAGELLVALDAMGVRSAIGSSSRNASVIMRRLRITERFAAVVDGAMVARGKPDPEVFVQAAQRCGVEPASCVVIEDAAAGVEAARRAGMACVGVGDAERLAAADDVVSDLEQLEVERLLDLVERRVWPASRRAA